VSRKSELFQTVGGVLELTGGVFEVLHSAHGLPAARVARGMRYRIIGRFVVDRVTGYSQGKVSSRLWDNNLLRRLGLFVEYGLTSGLTASQFALIISFCAMLALELAVDHGEAGGPDGVLLHLLAQNSHLVLGQPHPRSPPAARTGVWRRRRKLCKSIAGGDASNRAVYVGAGDTSHANAGRLKRSVLGQLEALGGAGEGRVGVRIVRR
jgi:hypothetical protein